MPRSVPGPVTGLPSIMSFPAVGLSNPSVKIDEGGFTAAAGSDDRDEFAVFDFQADIIQSKSLPPVRGW